MDGIRTKCVYVRMCVCVCVWVCVGGGGGGGEDWRSSVLSLLLVPDVIVLGLSELAFPAGLAAPTLMGRIPGANAGWCPGLGWLAAGRSRTATESNISIIYYISMARTYNGDIIIYHARHS